MQKSIHSYQQRKLQKLLRELRRQMGYRQKDLADVLNVPQSFVSKYEAGERRLDILELRSICESMGIKLEDFVRKLERIIDEA
ncbi:MAG: helix-turn-helix transcriptional regulator [Phycisphaerae bacterium]|nr:helix-turn-helix transcriptional regulator [Phycisphaerae bacterium]